MTYQLRMDERYAEGIAVGRDEGIPIGYNKGITVGEKRGEKRGITIGSHDARVEDARRALECGIPADTVAKFTGLPLDDVMALV